MSFESLLSDDLVFGADVHADIEASIKHLVETAEVKALVAELNEEKAKELIQCIKGWVEEPYNRRFRHPKDISITAGLVALAVWNSKAQEVQELFDYVGKISEPALVWPYAAVKVLKKS